MRSIRPRLTYANVIATIALFGVLAGGGAYAAQKIGPKDIRKNAVRAKHVKANQLKTRHLANSSVTRAKLRDAAIWARVEANGTISDQSGGITLISEVAGVYQLDVGRSVHAGAVVATPVASDPTNDGAVGAAICSHTNQCSGGASTSPSAIRVVTTNIAGNTVALPFYVAILR